MHLPASSPLNSQGVPAGLRAVCMASALCFRNSEGLRQHGLPRPDQVVSNAIASMPDSMRQAKIDWFLNLMQVCLHVYMHAKAIETSTSAYVMCTYQQRCAAEQAKGQMYRSRMDLHEILGPFFEDVTDALARFESKVRLFLSPHPGLMPHMLCTHHATLSLHRTHCASVLMPVHDRQACPAASSSATACSHQSRAASCETISLCSLGHTASVCSFVAHAPCNCVTPLYVRGL